MTLALVAAVVSIGAVADGGAPADGTTDRIEPVPFTSVKSRDRFWAPRIEIARTVTVPACFRECERTGRIANFDRAAGVDASPWSGNCYDDSDVYKVIEGASYCLAVAADPALDAYLDRLIARIAAAQEEDGYLYTIATAQHRPTDARWKDERWSHETYCAGHLFEAAVAHHQATGKDSLLDVATRFADLLVREFLRGDRSEVPGHEEVEIGLVRLSRETGNREYLDLARAFLLARGDASRHELYGEYAQDHAPVIAQREAVGHAVRAGYLYAGMADVASVTGEHTFDDSLRALWHDCVATKSAVTGGIGAHAHNEGFGDAYDLPNESAYNETCAAIANCLWQHRMFLLFGESAPIDVLERTLYNGMAAGVSLSGDRFFYPNPLACDGVRPFNHGTLGRAPWFGCACCPVNVARFVPSVPGFVYATARETIYVNLFIASDATIPLGDASVSVAQDTDFPWSSTVDLTITPSAPRAFSLALRVPSWARGEVSTASPYAWLNPVTDARGFTLTVNGEPVTPEILNGYARIDRSWQAGDRVHFEVPMPVGRITADSRIESTRDRVALGRGPIVYCIEATDVGARDARAGGRETLRDLWLPDDAPISTVARPDLLGGVVALMADAKRVDGSSVALTAVPYALWANREVGAMEVWIPRDPRAAESVPAETLASRAKATASHTWSSDTPLAVNDRRVPRSASDTRIPRHTWWDHKGTTEWVQLEWPAPVAISHVRAWFFDDTGNGGGCALPASWRLLARRGEAWVPLASSQGEVTGELDVSVPSTPTAALRLEVDLQPGLSAGVLEWTVE